jgi:hypothetical protein
VGEGVDEVDLVDLLDVGGAGADERWLLHHVHLLDVGAHPHHRVHLDRRVDAHPKPLLDVAGQPGGLRLQLELAGLQGREAEEALAIGEGDAAPADLRAGGDGDPHPLDRRAGRVIDAAHDRARVTSLRDGPGW